MERRGLSYAAMYTLGPHPTMTMLWVPPEVPALTLLVLKAYVSPLPDTGTDRVASSGRQWEMQNTCFTSGLCLGFGVGVSWCVCCSQVCSLQRRLDIPTSAGLG